MWVILLTLIGAAVRLFRLGAESLSFDEAYPVEAAKQSLAEILRHAPHDVHPPFYSFILHAWIKCFGDSETVLRLLPALFGIALIPVAAALARRLFGREAGLAAALLVSLSGLNIFFSQECRQYSFMNLMSACSYLFFVRMLAQERRRSDLVGYFASTGVLLYTHSFGALVLLSQTLFLLSRTQRPTLSGGMSGRGWVAVQMALWTVFLPWAAVSVRNAAFVNRHFWTEAFSARSFVTALLEWSGGGKLALVMTVFFAAAFWAARRKELRPGLVMMALWAAAVVGIPFLLSAVGTPVYYKRYGVAMALPLHLAAACGLAYLGGRKTKALAAVLWTLLAFNNIRSGFESTEREEWRTVVARISAEARAGDLVVINSRGVPAYRYYLTRSDLEMRVFPEMAYLTSFIYDWDHVVVTERNIGELETMTAARPRVWLIQSHQYDEAGLVDRTLEASHRRVFRQKVTGITLSFFEKEAAFKV